MDISFDIASFLFLFVYQYEGLRSDEPSLVSRNSWYLSFFTLQNDCQLSSKKGIRVEIVLYKSFFTLVFTGYVFVSRHFHHLSSRLKHELFGLEYHVIIVRDLFGRIDSPLSFC